MARASTSTGLLATFGLSMVAKLGRELIGMFCTYKTSHPSGLYYFGKSKVTLIFDGYKGSGKKLLKAFKIFAKETWITELLLKFELEQEAYEAEARLVTEETLKDPMCLNLQIGKITDLQWSLTKDSIWHSQIFNNQQIQAC